jgi:hypothetical protein
VGGSHRLNFCFGQQIGCKYKTPAHERTFPTLLVYCAPHSALKLRDHYYISTSTDADFVTSAAIAKSNAERLSEHVLTGVAGEV